MTKWVATFTEQGYWVPTLKIYGVLPINIDIAFTTKEECIGFIKSDLVGAKVEED